MKNLFNIRSGMGIPKRLLLLLLVVLVPLLLVQGFTYYEWFQERKEAELRANLELARTVAKTFDAFAKGILQTELAIGMAATASPALSPNDLRNIPSRPRKQILHSGIAAGSARRGRSLRPLIRSLRT